MIDIDIAVEAGAWPDEDTLRVLVQRALIATSDELDLGAGDTELSVVFTDDAAIRELNHQWRDKDKATNVLSFPAFQIAPGDAMPPMLGDIVIAFETVSAEAALEEKPFQNHLSHLVVHGVLHLLGHDHEIDAEAELMEDLERRVLARLAIPDPYV